ncbi:MAG: ATP-grasp domain-containing protein [Clostridiales bacterium]|nr:ATP-grasp domain-containing protein [Clostridiales bacterium]
MRSDFVPLIFAGDINVYSIARAFYEEYGVKSYAIGKYQAWPVSGSKILSYSPNQQADVQETFIGLVSEFAKRHEDRKVILQGCGDNYVRLVSQNIKNLPENVIAPCIGIDLLDSLTHKEKFYAMCEKAGIDYPDTFVHRKEAGAEFDLPFGGPFIIKPSNSIEYWRHPFPGQKKVFKAECRDELDGILGDIYGAGYSDSTIIQNFIPGDDSYMRVLTSYSDKSGKVRMMCLGHVLLEEHTPHGIGNHAVIITERNEGLEAKFKELLEGLNYVGYSNFDIKFDKRDGKFKAFEINARPGRSNYYVTNAGENVARCIVDDYIDNKTGECRFVDNETLWLVVPKKVAFDYVPHEKYRVQMRKLIKEGKCVNPLDYKPDGGFPRKLRFLRSQLSHFYKYRKYLGKQQVERD